MPSPRLQESPSASSTIRVAILSMVLSACASAQTVFIEPDVSLIERASVERIVSTLSVFV